MKKKSNDELITDLKYVPCEFSRDELFSVVVFSDAQLAGELKSRNKIGNLTVDEVKENYDRRKINSWYYYSN